MEAATSTDTSQNGSGEVALEGEGEEQVDVRNEVVIEGDGQLNLQIGGKTPTDSKVVLRGGQIPFTGQKKKGDHVALLIQARVAGVHVDDKIDSKTRDVVSTTRKHVLKVEGVQIVEEED